MRRVWAQALRVHDSGTLKDSSAVSYYLGVVSAVSRAL